MALLLSRTARKEPERCLHWYSGFGCPFAKLGKGTSGLCLNGHLSTNLPAWGPSAFFNSAGEACVHQDQNGIFFTYTEADPAKSIGVGAGVGMVVVGSNATDKNSLAGPFKYVAVSAVSGQVSHSIGTDSAEELVYVHSEGLAFGTPGVQVGENYTLVSGYLAKWCGFSLCD